MGENHLSPQILLQCKTAALSDDSAYIQDGSVKGWDSTTTLIQWDVNFRSTGRLDVALGLSNDEDNVGSSIKVIVGSAIVVGQTIFSGGVENFATMALGNVQVRETGLHTITVQAQGINGVYAGDLGFVLLSGPAASDAVEDQIPPKADAVHLSWGVENIALFYNSINILQSYPGTSFVACGSNDGYLGLQHLDFEGHKQVIFCIWDAYRGNGNDPDIPPDHHRVIVIERGQGVGVERFGKDGTGCKAFFPYAWQKSETYHFAMEAQVTEDSAQYSAYFYVNESNQWKKMATFRVRDDQKKLLTGLHSSIEDWRSGYGRHERKAIFSPAWYFAGGDWKQMIAPVFTQSGTLRNSNAGLNGMEKLFLITGGRTDQTTLPGTRLPSVRSSKLPAILNKLHH